MLRLFVSLTVFAVLMTSSAARADDGADYKLLRLDGHPVKWGTPRLGRGAQVSWRIAFGHGVAPGTENCRRTAGLDRMIEHAGLSREDALRAADLAFGLWSKAANLRFVPAASGEPADITLTAQADPDGIAFTDVVSHHAHQPYVRSMKRAIVCLNPQAEWTIAETGTYRLAYVMAHEIGHALGLDHPGPSGTLMSFEYDATRSSLAPGDIAGAIKLYGPAADIASR